MKKILIGTHNRGKFREIAYLISKRFKKISYENYLLKNLKVLDSAAVSIARDNEIPIKIFLKHEKSFLTFLYI